MIVVYTALFGKYDSLSPVGPIPGVRFVSFTDQPSVEGWECLRPTVTEATSVLENRKYKSRPHVLFPYADWTIYIDSNLRLTVDPRKIVEECRNGLNVFRHDLRDCLYEEAEIIRSRVDRVVLDGQLARYRQAGIEENAGLYWGGLLVRNELAVDFNECWWSEIRSGVFRDQVSLPYAALVSMVPFNVLNGDIPFNGAVNRFCERKNHLR